MRVKSILWVLLFLTCVIFSCRKKDVSKISSGSSFYNYYPLNVGNQWVYAINDVYFGQDTLEVKVIAQSMLSNNQPCWALSYKDLANFNEYNDTNFVYVSADTVLTYVTQNVNSLKEKWIFTNINNSKWVGVDTGDKYIFQTPIDSFSGFHITYYDLCYIGRRYFYTGYDSTFSDVEQLFFADSIGLCSFSISEMTSYPVWNQDWHLISYQVH
jgi:hypothetical protein